MIEENGTIYVLIFGNSFEQVCISKRSIDFARAERHRVLTAVYTKHKLYQQVKLGGDVELQDRHILLLKSHRVVTFDANNYAEH